MKNGILIIEDNAEDYKKIKNLILPLSCVSLLDQDEDDTDLSEKEIEAINIFSENQNTSLKKSVKFVNEIIQKKQDNLRMIICDLQINGNDQGGTLLIKDIKTLNSSNSGNHWFAQQIPILILSRMTEAKVYEAVLETIGRCLYFTKDAAFESHKVIKDVISFMVSDFDNKFKKQKFEKRYKVALSFTGSTTNEDGEEVYLRGFIEDIARVLYGEYCKDKVFFDVDKKTTTASRTKEELAALYKDSEYIVVFLSKSYVNKTSKWAKEEWSVIKKLVPEKRVLFVKLDSSIKSDDFKKKLCINEVLYDQLVASCSQYNGVIHGEDESYKLYIYENFDKVPVIKIAELAIKKYKDLLDHAVAEAANFIIGSIRRLDIERRNN